MYRGAVLGVALLLSAAPSHAQSLFEQDAVAWEVSRELTIEPLFNSSGAHMYLRRALGRAQAAVIVSSPTSKAPKPVRLALQVVGETRVVDCEEGRQLANAMESAGEWFCNFEPELLEAILSADELGAQVDAGGLLLPTHRPKVFEARFLRKVARSFRALP